MRCDYFRAVVWAPAAEVRAQVARLFEGSEWELSGGRHYYNQTAELCDFGARVYFEPVTGGTAAAGDGEHCCIEFAGKCLDQLPAVKLVAFWGSLDDAGWSWHATRLDLAWDHCGFTPTDLWAAVQARDVRTRAQRSGMRFQAALPGFLGNTLTIGSRQSGRFLRVYDGHGFTRCELEIKGERAELVRQELEFVALEEWSSHGLTHLRAFVDFVQRDARRNISECPLLPLWGAFVREAVRAPLTLPVRRPSIERAAAWLERNAATFAAVVQVNGQRYMHRLLVTGARRYGPRHRAMLQTARLAA